MSKEKVIKLKRMASVGDMVISDKTYKLSQQTDTKDMQK